jgi:hypothetical protein
MNGFRKCKKLAFTLKNVKTFVICGVILISVQFCVKTYFENVCKTKTDKSKNTNNSQTNPPKTEPSRFENFRDMVVRSDDTFIIGFPKSGTSLLTLVANLQI